MSSRLQIVSINEEDDEMVEPLVCPQCPIALTVEGKACSNSCHQEEVEEGLQKARLEEEGGPLGEER